VGRRAEESRRAARILGYGEPLFWGLPDRGVTYSEGLVQRLVLHIENERADVVYGPSMHEVHPDHRALGTALLEAVRRVARNLRYAMYEVGMPLHPNVLIDITGELGRKKEAIACFETQLEKQRYDEQILALNRYRTYTLPPEVKAAEAYRVVSPDDVRRELVSLYRREYPTMDGKPAVDPVGPLVTVVVRSLGRSTLAETLDSIALQTYANLEVVAVDAGGKGLPVGSVCGRFPMRVVSRGERLRRSRAANSGIEAARGRFVIFLDDDDWFYPNHVAELVNALESNRFARVAYGGIEAIDVQPDGSRVLKKRYNDPYDAIRILCQNYIPIHAVLFERALFDEGCRFDESLDLSEDWDFWIQVSRRTPFLHLPNLVGGAYRYPGGSALYEGSRERADESLRAVLEKWRKHWTPEELLALMDAARERLQPPT
jgi:hypothetical protein